MLNRTGLKLFRAAAYVLVLLAVVNFVAWLTERPPTDPARAQLLNLMQTLDSDIMGSRRTLWQFLQGFTFSVSILSLALGLLSLMVSRVLDWHVLRRVAALNATWLIAMTLVSVKYFFAVPTAFCGTATVLFAAAWWRIGRF